MATKLDKSIKRELEHQGKLYTITLAPDGVKVLEKGKRNGKELSWASIISGAATLIAYLKISAAPTRPPMNADRRRCSARATDLIAGRRGSQPS
jgi:hypothetical protein